jgi:microcystin-dependent protein
MPIDPSQPFNNLQPYVAVTFATPIGGQGVYPGSGPFGNTLGFIYAFAGTYAPGGGYLLDGRLVDVAADDTTFTIIGTIYGGNGTTNYVMPDLQGRAIIGDGTGAGLSPYLLGEPAGGADVSLTQVEIPPNAGIEGQPFSTVQPSLPLQRLICVDGAFPSQGGGSADATFFGQIATFDGIDVPTGWLEAAGQTLLIADNQVLFSVLGTTFGGNGTTNFQLPDLRGRVSVGADATHPLGTTFGQEAVALTLDNLPPPSGTDQPVNNDQPSLALNYIICTAGLFPQHDAGGTGFDVSQGVFGQIVEFAGNFAPSGWAFCDGTVLSIASNTSLFAILGTTYGGDGISTFVLPDLRGRTLIGAGTSGTHTYFVGETGGSDAITLAASNLPPPCFAAGTRILTARGEVAVEALTEADQVIVLGGTGTRPIRWIGYRRIALTCHPLTWDVLPVRVAAGAFAPGMPRHDLWLSPDHAVFLEGIDDRAAMLVPIRYLINGATIVQETIASVTYYHVELADSAGAAIHDVLLAEGMPVESYLDTGNRDAFANADGPVMLHADFAPGAAFATPCARLVMEGPDLLHVRASLITRAQQMGHILTDDPGLCLLADGIVVLPDHTAHPLRTGTYRFVLPTGTRTLRLWSRRAVPAHVRADSTDTRTLGAAVRGMLLDGRLVALDSPDLSDGWHASEPGWRWTAGNAGLQGAGARVLDIALLPMVAYWATPPAPNCDRAA